MKCMLCNAETDSKLCPRCIVDYNITDERQNSSLTKYSTRTSYENTPNNMYQSIGGWLLFIVIILWITIFGTAYSWTTWNDLFKGREPSTLLLFSVLFVISKVILLVQIHTKNMKFLLIYDIVLLVFCLDTIMHYEWLHKAYLFFLGHTNQLVYSIILNLVILVSFRIYFRVSLRVKGYMGSEEYLKKGLLEKIFPVSVDMNNKNLYRCNNCGYYLEPNAMFCQNCGTKQHR